MQVIQAIWDFNFWFHSNTSYYVSTTNKTQNMEKKNNSRVRIVLYVLFQIHDNADKCIAGPLSVEPKKKKIPFDENLRRK